MTPYLLFFLVSISALAWGSYTDFKERIVSNWLTWALVILGILGHVVWAFLANDAMIAVYSIGATIATFVLAYLLYRLGVWAGGDVKLFAGLAALNPVNPNILTRLGILGIPAFSAIELPAFPLTLFVFSLFSMLPYGAFLAGSRLLKNREEKKKFKQELGKRIVQGIVFSGTAIGASAVLSFLGLSQLIVLPILFLAAFLPRWARIGIGFVLFLFGLWFNQWQAMEQFLALLAFLLGLYLLFKLYSLSKVLMRKPVKISELEPGMISGQTLIEKGKNVEIAPELGIKKLIKYFAQNRFKAMELLQPKGRAIVSSRSAGGLTEEEIIELKRLSKEGKIGKSLLVKESAPFVPAVLIAYIALNIVGDVIWLWL